MPSLKDLGLKNEQVGGDVDFDHLPKVGGFTPLFQPGKYRGKLPTDLSNIWDKVDSQKGERITAIFDQNSPILIIQAPDKERVGEPFQTRVSNVERPRGRDKIEVSDMDYLLRAVGETSRPKTNPAYIQALMKHGGKEFPFVMEVHYSCNPNKNIYVPDGQGGYQEVDQKGCGARYYQNDVADQKVDGKFPERIVCGGENCGASLRGFNQMGAIG